MAAAAATATAVVGASFATATHNLKCVQPIVRIGCGPTTNVTRTLPLVWRCYAFAVDALSRPQRRRVIRFSGTVTQEEALVAEDEDAEVVESEAEAVAEAETAVGEEEAQVNTKLYFGNLPYHCDSAQLAGIVQQYGTPELVEVLYNRETGKSRGFAFVTMSTIEDADAVIENLDGSEYAGRYLRVNFADKPKAKEPLFPETEHKLFVGNLSWSATSENLHQMFQQCGDVVGARVLFDGETGRSRGYGFVCFKTQSEMENALTVLNGVELEGRAMRISVAQGKKA